MQARTEEHVASQRLEVQIALSCRSHRQAPYAQASRGHSDVKDQETSLSELLWTDVGARSPQPRLQVLGISKIRLGWQYRPTSEIHEMHHSLLRDMEHMIFTPLVIELLYKVELP